MLNQIRLPPEQMTERLCSCNQQQPLLALIALRNLTVEAISALASNEQKRRIFTILLHKCEFTDELREAEERHHAFINQFIDLCENLLRNASACLRPGVTPRLAALSLHAMVVGLFTDWTRDTELFAPEVDTKALIDPLFRGLVRDWRMTPTSSPVELSAHLITLFTDRLTDRLLAGTALHLHGSGRQVHLHLSLWVQRLNGLGYRTLAVAAGHSAHVEYLHRRSPRLVIAPILDLATRARSRPLLSQIMVLTLP